MENETEKKQQQWGVDFAERFATFRKKKFPKQTDFVAAMATNDINITQSTVSLWESGKRRPTLLDLPIIAGVLGVKVRELLPDE